MKNTFLIKLLIGIFAISFLTCCKKKGCTDESATNYNKKAKKDNGSCLYSEEVFDEKVLLANISENIILPAYNDATSKSEDLKTSIYAFTTSPSITSLANAKAKWSDALFSWQNIALFQIGPASDITLKEHINTYPTDTAGIKNYISSGSYNLESVSSFDKKGFQAIDYLLNSDTENNIILLFTTDNNAANRKIYLNDLANDISTKINSVSNEWENTYQSIFNKAIGTDIGSSIGLIVNELNSHYEKRIKDGKVAIPSGAKTFSLTPYPEKSEAYYNNQISRDLLSESLNALEQFYKGSGGEGLDDYLNFIDAKYNDANLDETIQNQFTVINNKVNNLSPSIAEDAQNNQNDLLSIFDDMQFLSSLLKVEMTNALEVEITYQDSDGD